MPKRQSPRRIQCRHFSWLLRRRGPKWVADGRGNTIPLERYSLGTDDYQLALKLLEKLDAKMGVQHGLAPANAVTAVSAEPLELEKGKQAYLAFAGRPRVAGGVRPSSLKRYRTALGKFCDFARTMGLKTWNEVTTAILQSYAAHLVSEEYAYRSQYTELTTLKQAIAWFRDEKFLPETNRIKLRLRKPEGTSTRCWTEVQISTVLNYCRNHPQLKWLADVILMMALTGLRISEVRDLRQTDIDLANGVLRLEDETAAAVGNGQEQRTLKGGRGRTFPIHERLRPTLVMRTSSNGPVFTGPQGGRLKPDLVRRKLINNVLESIAKDAGESMAATAFRELRPHGLRHFFCSLCANRGVPEQLVMRWLGHRDSRMVRHYYHVHDQEAMRQMQRLDVDFPENGAGA